MSSCVLVPVVKGKESILFRQILENGFSRDVAKALYDHIHSREFLDSFGDWINNPESVKDKLDENGEPRLEYLNSIFSEKISPSVSRIETQRYNKLSDYFGNSDTLGLDNVLASLKANSVDGDIEYLVDKLQSHSHLLPELKIEIDNTDDKYATYTTGKKLLSISRKINELSDEDFQRVILHEIVHAFTADVLVTDDGKLSDKQLDFKRNMIGLFNIAKHSGRGSGFDAQYKNVVEFVAEALTNQRFQTHLKSLNRGNIWERFLTLVKRLFGVRQNNKVADEVFAYIAEAPITTFKNTPMFAFHTPKYDEALFLRRKAIANSALRAVTRKISDIKKTAKSTDNFLSLKGLREKRDELKAKLAEDQVVGTMFEYANFAIRQLKDLQAALEREIKDDTLTLAKLNRIYNLARGHSVLQEIRDEINRSPDLRKAFSNVDADFIPDVNMAVGLLDSIKAEYTIRGKEFLVDDYSGLDRKVEAEIRLNAEREFNRNYLQQYKRNKASKAEINKARKAFIEKKVSEQNIKEQTRSRLRNVFDIGIQDISTLQMWTTATQHMNDDLLQLTKLYIDKAQNDIRLEYLEYEHRLVKELDLLKEYKGNLNPKELFDAFLEKDKDGKLTGHIISYVHNGYHEAFAEAYEKAAEIENYRDRKDFIAKWLLNNADVSPDWKKLLAEMRKERAKIKKEKGIEVAKIFENRWFEINNSKKWIPKPKWRNLQFNKFNPEHADYLGNNHPEVRFYKFIVESLQKQDEGRPENRKLGFRLPAIRKSVSERLFSSGSFSFNDVASLMKETVKIDEDDTEFGDRQNKAHLVYEDVEGDIQKGVPLYFTGKIDAKDQSYDIATLLAMNAHNSINYRGMTKILPQIQATKHLVANRPVAMKNAAGNPIIIADSNQEYTRRGEDTNIYKAFVNMVDAQVYGISNIPDQSLLGIGPKFWNSIISYTSTVMLAGNWVAGFANVSIGNALSWIEAAGGNHFSKGDLGKAYEHYLADTKGIIGDIESDRYASKTNLLSELFDATNDFRGAKFRYADNNRGKRLVKRDTLYAVNRVGEHWLQNSVMYAILNQAKVVNENGDYLDAEGNITDKPVSVLELYSVNEEGQLVLPDFVKKVERKGKLQDWNSDTQFEITQKIRHVNELLHGAYSKQNMPEMNRHIWGRLVLSMRKWIEPGFRKRFRGFDFKQIFKDGKPGEVFSQQLGEFEQGHYVTFLALASNIVKSAMKMQLTVIPLWNEMTDSEKAGVIKTTAELATAMAAIAMAKVLEGIARDAGDDEENKWFFAAYQANRLYTDLIFYVNPIEFLRILKDPTPTAGLLTDIAEFGHQLLPWNITDKYERGRRKGQYKIIKDAEKLFPFYRHVDRLFNMEEALDFFDLFI